MSILEIGSVFKFIDKSQRSRRLIIKRLLEFDVGIIMI